MGVKGYEFYIRGFMKEQRLVGGPLCVALLHFATKLNSVALVRTRTIPTERPPPVGEVSANFCG